MPFHNWNLYESKRRTSEPSPASSFYPDGWGKSAGSYTQAMREALYKWMNENLGSGYGVPLTFDYRLSRKRTVTVVAERPFIKHHPGYGRRGFVIIFQKVLSIDGVKLSRTCQIFNREFLMSRVVGNIPTKMLMAEGFSEVASKPWRLD